MSGNWTTLCSGRSSCVRGHRFSRRICPAIILGIETPIPATDDLRSALRHYERLHIRRVLQQWPDKREAAKRLRLGLSSFYRKIEDLEIDLGLRGLTQAESGYELPHWCPPAIPC